jgi:NADPH-dependent curcumin reductase CurA
MPRQIVLAARPSGWPTDDNFALTEADRPDLADGQVRVRNLFMSVDPYMRGRMNDVKSYVPPFRLGEPLEGGAIGEVIESRSPDLAPGDLVMHMLGWRDEAVLPARQARTVTPENGLSPSAYLGVLGMTTLTAYVGLLDIAAFKPGEVVFVSGAAGAVGSMAGQIAKIKGAGRVIGIAGGPEKCRALTEEFGFDAAIDYRAGNVRRALREHTPDGVDVYFDNVGGEILDDVLTRLALGARVVICGAVSQYNEAQVRGPANYMMLLVARASMTGMLVFDYVDRYPQALAELAGWLKDGKLVSREHVVHGGVDAFPETLLMLFDGVNTGKLVIELDRS